MSRRKKRTNKKPTRVELTRQEAREFMRTVHDDLVYLQRQDMSTPSLTDVRLAGAVLRRLLHDGLLCGAWQFAGFPGEPKVQAVDLDAVVGETPRRYIHYAYAGGARTSGPHHAGYVLLVVPKQEAEVEGAERVAARVRQGMRPGERRTFSLSQFCQSPCLISGSAEVSRVELVRYVANKLGGVHWDHQRQAWTHPVGSRHRLLDEQHLFVGKLSAPFYELVSIAVNIAGAPDVSALVDRINEVASEEPRDPLALSFREGRIGKYSEMTFAPKVIPDTTADESDDASPPKPAQPARNTGATTLNPRDAFVDQYRVAAGEGALLELKMRLLANKVPALRPYLGNNLADVEEQIIALFGKELQGREPEQLRLCRQLRNKVLHCDFPQARSKLQELGAPQVRGGVREIMITDPTPGGLVQHMTSAAAGAPGSYRHVADLTSRSEANVFGWLLELGAAGDFGRATEVFRVACKIVDRLAIADAG